VPSVCVAVAVLQAGSGGSQTPLGAIILAGGAILAAVIAAVGGFIAQSKRLDRLETDHASWIAEEARMRRLESDLAVFLSSRETGKVMRPLIDAFTDRLGLEPSKSVTLAVYLRRVAEDEMMRRMTEVLESRRAEDVKKEYDALKRNLTEADTPEEDGEGPDRRD